MENTTKIFSPYLILYTLFTILLIVIPLMISVMVILSKIGMTAVISFFVIVSIGAYFLFIWMFLFYTLNLFFYFKKQYPHRSDNIFINTFSNVIIIMVVVGINEYTALLAVFPTINLLVNFKYFLKLLPIVENPKSVA
ncbi:hypothetical protein M0R01_02360 [bacterium]|nr:hypothetical protein [bacterium]